MKPCTTPVHPTMPGPTRFCGRPGTVRLTSSVRDDLDGEVRCDVHAERAVSDLLARVRQDDQSVRLVIEPV